MKFCWDLVRYFVPEIKSDETPQGFHVVAILFSHSTTEVKPTLQEVDSKRHLYSEKNLPFRVFGSK